MRKPHIALVVLDTVRFQSTSLYDRSLETTPFLERFAEQAVQYDQARASSPWTLPSHASLFTGLYPGEHRVSNVDPYLSPEVPTLAELLRSDGYATVGVSANTWVGPDFGLARGFDRYARAWQLADTSADFSGPTRLISEDRLARVRRTAAANPARTWAPMAVNTLYAATRSHGHFHGTRVARLALRGVRAAATARPLFLFVNFLDAHMPYAPPRWARTHFGVSRKRAHEIEQAPYKYMIGCLDLTANDLEVLKRLYHAEIAALDRIVSDFLSEIQRTLGPNTLLIVTSDHGENVGEHGLLDHQFSLHDTLLRVPLLVRYPGGEAAGERRGDLVQWQDLFATVLESAGVVHERTPSSRLLPGPPGGAPREFLLAEYPFAQPAPEALAKRYPGADVSRVSRTLTAVVDEQLTKAIWSSDGTTELYATGPDPWEEQSLGDEVLLAAISRLRDEAMQMLRVDERELPKIDIQQEIRRQLEAIGYF